jgi:hypothetical protein
MEEVLVVLTVTNVVMGILNTYWAFKRTCYNRDTLSGSQRYWGSWSKRSKDVSEKVLKEIPISQLKKALKEREKK